MFYFKITVDEMEFNEIAETAGKAKYQCWLELQDGIWEAPFGEIVKHMRCKKVGVAGIHHLFGDADQFKRVCKGRGISFAYMGMKIEVAGKMGTIVGANDSCNLEVVNDGEWFSRNCHPWDETRYFDKNGNVVADYTKQAQTC